MPTTSDEFRRLWEEKRKRRMNPEGILFACLTCEKEVFVRKLGKDWKPFNKDGTWHECPPEGWVSDLTTAKLEIRAQALLQAIQQRESREAGIDADN